MYDHATPPTPPTGRRRVTEAAGRRPSPLTVLAVAIPLLTVAALAIVRPADEPPFERGPAHQGSLAIGFVEILIVGDAAQRADRGRDLIGRDLRVGARTHEVVEVAVAVVRERIGEVFGAAVVARLLQIGVRVRELG